MAIFLSYILLLMKILTRIAEGFTSLFLWLEEHQIGILTTIAIHLFIISAFLILKINTYTQRDYQILIDVSQVNMEEQREDEPLPKEESTQEMIQNLRQEYNIRNIPINTADNRAVANIDKMVQDIKTEMNITDPKPLQDHPEEVPQKEDKLLENEARIYDEKFPTTATGERVIYKGPTTVSYELANRRHKSIPVPAYKCQGEGKVIVDIKVNRRGYVLSAKINEKSSQDPCMIEAAKRNAEISRFSESTTAEAEQSGTITYIFIAQ